jgi:selenide,water dikinase
MRTLNAAAAEAMRQTGIGADSAVHAATDITGFGLLGHLFHLARASAVSVEIDSAAIPALPEAEALAKAGNVTRGDRDNRAYLGERLQVDSSVAPERLSLLLDPQTSGGLAICVAEKALPALLERLAALGVTTQAVIGRIVATVSPSIRVR